MNLNAAVEPEVNLAGIEYQDPRSARILDLDVSGTQAQAKGEAEQPPHRILFFLAELRRRQVCRTITMYSIALWLVCQVVDVVSAPLALPDWTLKFVIVIGLIGYPIAMVLSWLFDINRDGVVNAAPGKGRLLVRRPLDRVLDCSLVALAFVIGAQLAAGTLWADGHQGRISEQRIAVVPFQPASNGDAEVLVHSLVSELQHQLASTPGMTVMFWREAGNNRSGYTLTGSVSTSTNAVRVLATLVDNRTDEVTWTRAIEVPVEPGADLAPILALSIVQSIPQVGGSGSREVADNGN